MKGKMIPQGKGLGPGWASWKKGTGSCSELLQGVA